MRPINQCPETVLQQVDFILTDIDDTLTDDGRLKAPAYGAMQDLQSTGIKVVPITGRPAGWCDMIARQWPVNGVVGENGAFYFRYDDDANKMIRNYFLSPEERQKNTTKLNTIRDEILDTIADAAVSADQAYREADLAIDYCEDISPLAEGDVKRIVEIFEKHGAIAKISSIHVNGWFGDYDKLSMTRRFMSDCYNLDLDKDNTRCLFVGDSPNDAPMFGFFANSVGVANVRDLLEQCQHQPSWITEHRGGVGFVELAKLLLNARK